MKASIGGPPKGSNAIKRRFAHSSHYGSGNEEPEEAAKWRKLTFLGALGCLCLGIQTMSGDHAHHDHEERPAYSYLHIRNKEFPWGYIKLINLCIDGHLM
ncbi:unnamed protein product [Calypogeia fissa]